MSSWLHSVVTLSGLPGSGTTTAARLVTEATGFRHVNTGAVFRQMAAERGMALNDFGKLANDNPEIDRELDARQIAIARGGEILLEGRLAGYMLKDAGVDCLAVWLDAPIDVRIQRVSGRERLALDEARRLSLEREEDERKRFIEFYGFDLARTEVYDLVLDSSQMSPEAICDAILSSLRGS
jgi:cytidylate kinase